MMPFLKYAFTCAILLLGCSLSYSQDLQDSVKTTKTRKRTFLGNIFYGIKTSFGKDTTGRRETTTVLNTDALLPYEGKPIRSITTRQLGFEMSIADTSNDFIYFGTQVLNRVHIKSKEYTIRRNLYIKEGMRMNAYLIADNERFLRTIGYIQDSRIIVNKRTSTSDSVDLIVITKDLFSFIPSIGGISPFRQRIGMSDNNIMGTGQNASFVVLHDNSRDPSVGIQTGYGYNNIMGSFINTSVGYSRIAQNIYDHREDEENYMLSFDRPLVSQYKRMAGGFTIGAARSLNIYPNDYYGIGYYRYQYGLIDGWMGYNIGAKKYLTDQKMHIKKFIAVRYFNTHFYETPSQVNESVFDQRFNSNQGFLVGLTLFRQYYYKTKYIYGFGVTEDVPTGFNVSFNAGWYKQLDLSRPYFGVDAYRYFVTARRGIGCLFLRTGGFLGQSQLQDVGLLMGASFYSRIINVSATKMRQYFRISYGDILNRIALDPLRIDNTLGLRSFNSDFASGNSRLALRSESEFFLQQKYFGFKLAPFLTGDLIFLNDNKSTTDQSGTFYGVGGGLRTRNENLVLGTIEFRCIVYPRKVLGDNTIKLNLAVNLKFRYNNSYVNKPNIIELNSDSYGDIY
jgi:hypothetical protein